MNKHPVEAEELQAYLDRELTPGRQREIAEHVRECQECSAMIGDLQKVSATLLRWQVGPVPASLRPPLVRDENPQASFSWTRLALTLSGATAVVLLVAAISIPNLLRSRISTNQSARPGASQVTPQMGTRETAADEANEAVSKDKPFPDRAAIGRLISYQVTMTVEVKEFDFAKKKLLEIMDAEQGYVARSSFAETPNQPRRANLVLRVPAARLATILEQIRGLGRVNQENLISEEVTDQVVDLEARLHNARSTEQRLIDVLNTRTGKVRDILEVEQEIARTRQEIERMDAQRQNLMHRVELATVNLTLAEEFKAQLEPTPVGTGTRLQNAFVEGYQNFVGTFLAFAFFFARNGLNLVFWGGIAWVTWRLLKRRLKKLVWPEA